MDNLRKPYNKFREVLMEPMPDEIQPPSDQKRNAEIKNHRQYNPIPHKQKIDTNKNSYPYTQQYQSIVEESIISSLPQFPTKKNSSINPEAILTQERTQLEIYKQKLRSKKKSKRKSMLGLQIEADLKNIMERVGTLTKKVEFMNSRTNIKLKQSSTFNTELLNGGGKKRHYNAYQEQMETDRPRMITQYDRLREICRPDFLKTHRQSTLNSNGSDNNMIKSMLNRQKSEESIFNRGEINKFLSKQRHRKHSNLAPGNGNFDMMKKSNNLLRNLTYKDVDNSASGDD